MTELLSNHLGGRWQAGTGTGTALFDPVLGTELVRVDATGLDLKAGFAFARQQGGAACRRRSLLSPARLRAAAQVPGAARPRGIIVIAHGMAEHASRYARFLRRIALQGAGGDEIIIKIEDGRCGQERVPVRPRLH